MLDLSIVHSLCSNDHIILISQTVYTIVKTLYMTSSCISQMTYKPNKLGQLDCIYIVFDL